MKTLKKTLCLVLAVVMVVGTLAVSTASAFNDDASIKTEYKEAVALISGLKIMVGSNDNFNPKGELTREEAARIIACVHAGPDAVAALTGTKSSYDDVPDGWAVPAIEYCRNMELMLGTGGNNFGYGTKLTGAMLERMLLEALGYKAAAVGITPANWQSMTMNVAYSVGLTAGLTKEWSAINNITREEACRMAYNALFAEEVVYTGGASVDTGAGITVQVGYVKQGQESCLGRRVHHVAVKPQVGNHFPVDVAADTTDDYGRPTTEYKDSTGDVIATAVATPAFIITESMTESQLYAKIADKGEVGTGNRYIVMDKVFVDGRLVAKSSPKKADNTDATGDDPIAYWAEDTSLTGRDAGFDNTVIIVNNDKSNISGLSNYSTTEIYKSSTNHYTMVVTNEYVGVVEGDPVPANKDTGTKRYVNIRITNLQNGGNSLLPFESETLNKDDIVLVKAHWDVAKNVVDSAPILAPAVSAGTVDRIVEGKSITVNGTEYPLSGKLFDVNVGTTWSKDLKADIYLDSLGNVVYMKQPAAAKVETKYAFVLDATNATDSFTEKKAELLFADGTTKVVPTKANAFDQKNYIVTYTEKDGVYTLTNLKHTYSSSDYNIGKKYSGTSSDKVFVTMKNGSANLKVEGSTNGTTAILAESAIGTNNALNYTVIDKNTVIVIATTVSGATKYTAYVGYNAVPTFGGTAGTNFVAGFAAVGDYTTGVASFIYIDNTTHGTGEEQTLSTDSSVTSSTVTFVAGTKVSSVSDSDGGYDIYNAVVGGTIQQIKVKTGTSITKVGSSNNAYAWQSYKTEGGLVTNVTAFTAAAAPQTTAPTTTEYGYMTGTTAIKNGVVTLGTSGTTKAYSVADNCVFYAIDGATITAITIDDIKLDASTDVLFTCNAKGQIVNFITVK